MEFDILDSPILQQTEEGAVDHKVKNTAAKNGVRAAFG